MNLKRGEKVAKYSTYINLFLTVVKGAVGYISGSISLIADAMHSFSDIFSSLAVYLGLKISQRKPNQRFPYGYYKVETFVSFVVSVLILVAGIEIMYESIKSIINPHTLKYPTIGIVIALLSAIICYILAIYKEKIGKKIGSQALINDGKHSLIDTFSSLIVFIGILSSFFGYEWIEGLAGIIISILIFHMGIELCKADILALLDAGIDPKIINKIKNIAEKVDGVRGAHAIRLRRCGPYIFGEMHLELDPEKTIKDAHKIILKVKDKVKDEIKSVDILTIQTEAFEKNYKIVAVPLKNGEVSGHLGKASHFAIAKIVDNKITKIEMKENPGAKVEKKKGIKAAKFLKSENIDILAIKNPSKNLEFLLPECKIVKAEGSSLEEIIKNAVKAKS